MSDTKELYKQIKSMVMLHKLKNISRSGLSKLTIFNKNKLTELKSEKQNHKHQFHSIPSAIQLVFFSLAYTIAILTFTVAHRT